VADFGVTETAAIVGTELAADAAAGAAASGAAAGAAGAGAGLAGAGAAGAGAGAGAGILGTGLSLSQLAALTSIAGTLGSLGMGLANRPSQPGMPTPGQIDPSTIARTLLPASKANAAARVGGGLSPEFTANMIDESSGQPGGGMDILSEIRRSLNTQAP
jgi:hypothetical protein